MPTQEVSSVTCPNCGFRYSASVTSVIDVGSQPELKTSFLQGTLNQSQCPRCNFEGPLNLPLFYHDAEKELALAYIPTELQLSHMEEQRVIGDLSNRIMNQLPPEQRRAYLLTPKTFLTMESIIKAILSADGITEEMLNAQTEKMRLLDQFTRVQDEESLKKLVEDNDAAIDYNFFEILTATALQALQGGNENLGQSLLGLRQAIAQYSSQAADAIPKVDAALGFQVLSADNLLKMLREAETEAEFAELVSRGRGLLDYNFFQNLTASINQAQADGEQIEANALLTLRTRILDAVSVIDEEIRNQTQQHSQRIQAILEADDPQAYIREHINEFDEGFLTVLNTNIEFAQQNNQTDLAQQLVQISQMILQALQSQLPPEMHLLNQLVQAESPQALETMLQAARDQLTPQFFSLLDQIQRDFASRGEPRVAQMLERIKQQASSLTTSG